MTIARFPALLLLALLFAVSVVTRAHAQEAPDTPPDVRQPIGRFAADVRVSMPRFKQINAIAESIARESTDLPSRGLGLVGGAHVYPFRLGRVTVGFGGELMRSRGRRTQKPADDTAPDGPTVTTRFSSIAPQVSLNFGAREGWSYVSGGVGWSRFSVERTDEGTPPAPALEDEDNPRVRTLNYGGGARWFPKPHIGVSIDLRLYNVGAQAATASRAGLPRMTMMVLSVGAAFK